MFRIGSFELSLSRHELTFDGVAVPLRPTAFNLLAYLAANPGRLVTKAELLAHLWRDRFVEEAVVKVAVRELRKVLGDDARRPRIIQTVHRCGYKLVAPVAPFTGRDRAAGPVRDHSRRRPAGVCHAR